MSGQPRPHLSAAVDRHARRGGPPSWLASVDRLIEAAGRGVAANLAFQRYQAAKASRPAPLDPRSPDEVLAGIVSGLQGFEPRPLPPLAVRRAVVEPI